jgi:hypothetical protein
LSGRSCARRAVHRTAATTSSAARNAIPGGNMAVILRDVVSNAKNLLPAGTHSPRA